MNPETAPKRSSPIWVHIVWNLDYLQGFFSVFSQAKIQPYPHWNSGDFFPISQKKSQSSKKKNFFFSFLKIGIFIQSTSTLYMVMFSFNLMSIVCVIANLFFIDQN